jgi:DNA invertase Pin-like site-specific DNA recombinase
MKTDHPALAYSYVRLSTLEQLSGHGRQRQIERSIAWAKKHGLKWADEAQIEDVGRSAFTGANVKGGALGKFLKAVEEDKVKKGSYLIVESLDRLSRQKPADALALFLDIIRADINVVTLEDERIYRGQNTNEMELFGSLMILSRAYKESATKQDRLSLAWAEKRKRARDNSTPLTATCPAWLHLPKGSDRFELRPDRVAAVKMIFEETVRGVGSQALVKRLNHKQNGIRNIGSETPFWNRSYIERILKNKAVIGEYQPYRSTPGRKRIPEGEPIKNYFPPIIEKDLFYRAQRCREERRITGRGRKGAYFTNLFSGLARCAYCEAPMTVQNKGAGPKGGRFLVCSAAKSGLDCATTGWRYDHFERSFLAFVEKVDLPTLLDNADPEKKALDDELQSIEGKLLALKNEFERTYAMLQRLESSVAAATDSLLAAKFDSVQQAYADTKKRRDDLTSELEKRAFDRRDYYKERKDIRSLIERLQDQTSRGVDLYKLRAQVSDRIKVIVKELRLATIGGEPFVDGRYTYKHPRATGADTPRHGLFLEGRFFEVTFKDNTRLGIEPNRDNPLELRYFFESEQLGGGHLLDAMSEPDIKSHPKVI